MRRTGADRIEAASLLPSKEDFTIFVRSCITWFFRALTAQTVGAMAYQRIKGKPNVLAGG